MEYSSVLYISERGQPKDHTSLSCFYFLLQSQDSLMILQYSWFNSGQNLPNLYNLQKQAKFKLTEYIEMMQSLINFLNLDLGRDKPYFVKTTPILQNSFDNFRLKLSTTSWVSQLVLTVRILLETCCVSRMHHTSYMGLLKNKLV